MSGSPTWAPRPSATGPVRSGASLTLRLTLLFALASSIVLLTLGQLIGRSVERHFVELDREVAEGKLVSAAALLAAVRSPTDVEHVGGRFDSMMVGHDGLALRVEDRAGRVWFSSPEAEQLVSGVADAQATPGARPRVHFHAAGAHPVAHGDPLPIVWTHEGRTFRGLARALESGLTDARSVVVTVGVDTAHHEHYMALFRQTLWSFVAVAMLVTGVLGWLAARSGLAPLRTLGREAATVTASQLDRRLSAGQLPVEVAELARTLNDMLARLEDSFQRLSDLSSDLAHELRTPLTNLMTQTQVGLSRARSADDYREVLTSNSEELERLARMVSDMLFLAKSEHGLARPDNVPVDLGALAQQVLSFYEALAADRRVAFRVDGAATLDGDRPLLLRALANLVANAIQHATPGTEVLIGITPTPQASAVPGVRLAVRNRGETISAEVLARMFDRFFRGDASRQRATDGAGL
ncbi:MAG: heavy metal sensor histidine kinase, partial [Proteobacteria bacterium]|nr:heavy metal sensor histidine kinase [Burkholderiales bacterium]